MGDVEIAQAIVVASCSLFGKALFACLARGGHRILGEAKNLDEALEQIEEVNPNLAVLGPHLVEPCLWMCREIIHHSPQMKVIIFTDYADEPSFQVEAVYVGASACLSLDIAEEKLLTMIEQVLAGQRLFSHEILSLAFQPINLTARELQVLKLMAGGKTDREIAKALGVQFNTVRNHTRHILEKFNVHHRQEAVSRARHRGLG